MRVEFPVSAGEVSPSPVEGEGTNARALASGRACGKRPYAFLPTARASEDA